MRREPLSLRLRLTLLTVSVIVLALVAFGGLAGALLWRIELSSTSRLVSAQADELVAVAQQAPGALPDTAGDLLERDGVTAVARVYEGSRLVWSGGAAGPETLDPAFLSGAQAERVSRTQDYLIASRRFPGGVVQVGRNLRPLRQLLARYLVAALLALLLLAGLAAWGAAWVVRGALSPLERLARRVEHLDTPEPVPGVHEGGEVGALARALETSLAELRAERARETLFLASASHELRTPVTAMLADLQHSLARPRSEAETLSALRRTEKTATRLRQLTGNLMSLTRAQHSTERQEADLLELAGEAVDLLQPLALAREIDLWLDGAPTPAQVDSSLFSGVLENLIGNALKFSPPGGRVNVIVRPCADGAELTVEDSGPGFPEGALSGALTEAFVRGAAGVGGPEGFGLGLAVVRQVVEAHGGALELGSRPGGGARARVTLPPV
jgi:signal transduction histidine kinase